jgi:hypothetical protein
MNILPGRKRQPSRFLAPVIVIIVMLTTIWTYNNFVYVWPTTQGGPGNYIQVLATQMYTEAFVNYRLGYGASVGVLMSFIMLISWPPYPPSSFFSFCNASWFPV